MEFIGRKKINTELNIAPLVDVVFLLLIFFMLSANVITRQGIKLTLPSSSSGTSQPERIIISVAKDGRYFLNGDVVRLKELPQLLRGRLAASTDKTVTIEADAGVDLGDAVRLMDMARAASAEGVVLSTRKGGHDHP